MGQITLLNSDLIALVDDCFVVELIGYSWYINSRGYAVSAVFDNNGKLSVLFMHKLILPNDDNMLVVDHINRNRLDNRKENLRICTRSQNSANRNKRKNETTSKYKGVHKYGKNTYQAAITCNKKTYTKSFMDEILAAKWYDSMASKLFGEYAALNFPDEELLKIEHDIEERKNGRKNKNQSSKYYGVSYFKESNKWMAKIQVDKKRLFLGLFALEKDAAFAYDQAARFISGDKYRLNFENEEKNIIDIFSIFNRIKTKYTSKYFGVSWCKQRNKWRVKATVNGKSVGLGYFENEIEAAKTYDEFVIKNCLNKKINFQ